MTGPLGGGGISTWPQSKAGVPIGSERSQYWYGTPPAASGINANWWRTRDGAAVQAANVVTGAAGTYAYTGSLPDGPVRQMFGVENGAPTYMTINQQGLTWAPPNMAAPFGAPQLLGDEVFIFREAIRYRFEVAAPNVNGVAMHGFSLVENLNAGFPMLTAGSWRGIGLAMIGGGASYAVYVKDANPGTSIPLTGANINLTGAALTLVEHRLYKPTASRMGRYELWINEQRILTVNGDHASFPRPVAGGAGIADAFRCLPFAMDVPGGTCRVLQVAAYGEIIMGPDSDGTF